ncbi:hypothetical protein C7N43_32040 [Sphingobacteriales bacterium UPWRP_1]|nr:hypothetical protein BVG80_01390 [Sphingobacteriales bacterium TSM_CSM]PSJ72863.1 hypothetical protein C7N43_32040 [Sphingobacteriales bacterium UPWRP_1]
MPQPQNVIIIVADSLRFDSVYAGNNILLPYLAANGLQYTQARSGGCWTLPATASLFTGLMPHQHGATSQTRKIYDNVPTLAEQMTLLGYDSRQVTANVATTDIFGLHRGFAEVHRIWKMVPAKFNLFQKILGIVGKPRLRHMLLSKDLLSMKMSEDLEATKSWLQFTHLDTFNQARKIIAQNEASNKKSFLFINLMESHFPYHVAPSFQLAAPGFFNKFREAAGLFHLVNQTFYKTGQLQIKDNMLQHFKHRQRTSWELIAPAINQFAEEMHKDRNTMLIFCADHGENFGEQNWLYHFSNVTEAGNHVPLFILNPYQNHAATIDTEVSTKDLYHTILATCGGNNPGASLCTEPQASIPVMQSYWYNNHGKTLPQYRFNQICYVNSGNRYLYREGNWYTAPASRFTETETDFMPVPQNANPLYDCIDNVSLRNQMLQIFSDFLAFSQKIGTGK